MSYWYMCIYRTQPIPLYQTTYLFIPMSYWYMCIYRTQPIPLYQELIIIVIINSWLYPTAYLITPMSYWYIYSTSNNNQLHLKEILSFPLSQYAKYTSLLLYKKKIYIYICMYPSLFICYNAYFDVYWVFIFLISFISTIQPGWGLGGNNLSTFVHTNLPALVTRAQYIALCDTCTISLLQLKITATSSKGVHRKP